LTQLADLAPVATADVGAIGVEVALGVGAALVGVALRVDAEGDADDGVTVDVAGPVVEEPQPATAPTTARPSELATSRTRSRSRLG
jgi:hypothetical protein